MQKCFFQSGCFFFPQLLIKINHLIKRQIWDVPFIQTFSVFKNCRIPFRLRFFLVFPLSQFRADRCHKRLDDLPFSAKHPVSLQHQKRPEAFASRTHTVIHRLKNRFLKSFFFRKIVFQNPGDLFLAFFHLQIKIHLLLPLHSKQEFSFLRYQSADCRTL